MRYWRPGAFRAVQPRPAPGWSRAASTSPIVWMPFMNYMQLEPCLPFVRAEAREGHVDHLTFFLTIHPALLALLGVAGLVFQAVSAGAETLIYPMCWVFVV